MASSIQRKLQWILDFPEEEMFAENNSKKVKTLGLFIQRTKGLENKAR